MENGGVMTWWENQEESTQTSNTGQWGGSKQGVLLTTAAVRDPTGVWKIVGATDVHT
jgi:hypothetical protein